MLTKNLLVLAGAGLIAASGAQSATFSSALVPGINTISDDNAEIVIKADGNGGYRPFFVGIDQIGVGDLLIGVVGITSFPISGANPVTTNQVSAVYATQVLTAQDVGPLLDAAVCGAATVTTCSAYTFSAPSIGLNASFTLANLLYGAAFGTTYANLTANSFAVVLEDTTGATAFTRTGALNAATASASDGVERFVFDLIAGNGNVFNTTGPADVAQLALVAVGTGVGAISGNATVAYQNVPGWLFNPNVTFQGSIAQASDTPYPIWSNTDYTLVAQRVPEPGALALAGIALAGLGAVRRRSKKV